MSSSPDKIPHPQLELSIVVPIYNEEGNIDRLHSELTAALAASGRDYEVIAINDGSQDGSYELLNAVGARDPRWHIIHFRRNFGQTAAMAAGFDAARGEIVVTIDADLQNDPRDIERLLDKFAEGYDIVSGWRQDRKESLFLRRIPSALANRLISRSTGIKLHDYGCTLKAYHFDVVKGIQLYGELHRFIPALARQMGVRVAEIPVTDRARQWGSSKYGFSPHVQSRARPHRGGIHTELLQSPALRLWGGWLPGRRHRHAAGRLFDRLQAADREQDWGSPAAAVGRPADGAGRAIRQHRHRRRYDHAHLPRVAAQTDLLCTRTTAQPAGAGGRR